jgi:hypothetical protein
VNRLIAPSHRIFPFAFFVPLWSEDFVITFLPRRNGTLICSSPENLAAFH